MHFNMTAKSIRRNTVKIWTIAKCKMFAKVKGSRATSLNLAFFAKRENDNFFSIFQKKPSQMKMKTNKQEQLTQKHHQLNCFSPTNHKVLSQLGFSLTVDSEQLLSKHHQRLCFVASQSQSSQGFVFAGFSLIVDSEQLLPKHHPLLCLLLTNHNTLLFSMRASVSFYTVNSCYSSIISCSVSRQPIPACYCLYAGLLSESRR